MLSAGRSAWAKAIAIAIAVLLVDLGSKALVSSSLGLYESHQLHPDLTIFRVHNPGVSLSFINGGIQLPFHLLIAVVILMALHLLTHPPQPLLWLASGLLVGGVLGNFLELLHHGYATDFIQVNDWRLVFNFADVAITLYILLTFFFLIRRRLRTGPGPGKFLRQPPDRIGTL